MVATEISKRKGQPPPRAGTVDVDLAVIAALREYVVAADQFAVAKSTMEAARAALDDAAGTHAEVTYGGETAWKFKPYQRRTADLNRLKKRHPEAYADVVDEATSYRLDIDGEWRRVLRLRTWRAALRRKTTS